MALDPKLFAQLGGWSGLRWHPADAAQDPLAGLFPDGGTLLLGIGEDDRFTLTWLDGGDRLHSLPGFFVAGLGTAGGVPALDNQSALPKGGKEPYEIRLTLAEAKAGELLRLTLTGTVSSPPRGTGTGPVGRFTAHADPMGTQRPAAEPPLLGPLLRRLRRLVSSGEPRLGRPLAP